ncbi:hypothetical protein WJX72_003775 [[Myrmecia] bisecta]|uniref:Uncharacterized protein n=1 Tax=[Myrmecia] bisecta TaxID=41462 RepID=A0AAW1Q0X1_9CHLO
MLRLTSSSARGFAELARCRQRMELQGREQYLGQLIEHAYQEQLAQHADKVTDERSQTHLQVACLVLATAEVLRPWIRNDKELMSIISAHMGNQTSPLLRFLLRFTLYLYPDAYASTVNRLRMLQMDYGSGFESRLEKGPDASELTVTSCFYQRLFEEQDFGRLAACCCCSQDAVWFRQLEKHGAFNLQQA